MIKMVKYLKPYIWLLFATILFMFGQAMAELFLPTLMSDVVNKGMVTGDTSLILKYGSYMLMVALGSTACAIIGSYFSSVVAVSVGRDLRVAVFTRVESYSLSEFDKFGVASLITRTTNDIVQVQAALLMMFRFLFYAPIMCIGGIVMALSMDKGLTIVIGVAIPFQLLLMAVIGTIAMPLFKAMQKKIDKLNLVAREGLTGIRVIRAFNKTEYEAERFETANKDLLQNAIKVNRIMVFMQPIMILIMNLMSLAIIWFGGHRIDLGRTDLGSMMAFLQYAMMIFMSFIMVSIMFIMIPRASASAERINEVIDVVPEINDPETAEKPAESLGVLEFKNVRFRYEDGEHPALKDISFTAEPGKTTAIIGGTGSGKSTLVSLIPRFYDVEDGEILLDGVDIRRMPQRELRGRIGLVPQKAVLFSDTVKGNIAYGNGDATMDDIIHAAKIAQADDFVSKMQEGYDSVIAQGGSNISGGQRQRLSIARAIVRKPLIYIFDDSFSALDFKTDAALRAALSKETNNSTVIIVAQRVSSIMDADTIITLDHGEIAGIGTHRELLESCDVYREIVMSQLSEEEMQ